MENYCVVPTKHNSKYVNLKVNFGWWKNKNRKTTQRDQRRSLRLNWNWKMIVVHSGIVFEVNQPPVKWFQLFPKKLNENQLIFGLNFWILEANQDNDFCRNSIWWHSFAGYWIGRFSLRFWTVCRLDSAVSKQTDFLACKSKRTSSKIFNCFLFRFALRRNVFLSLSLIISVAIYSICSRQQLTVFVQMWRSLFGQQFKWAIKWYVNVAIEFAKHENANENEIKEICTKWK